MSTSQIYIKHDGPDFYVVTADGTEGPMSMAEAMKVYGQLMTARQDAPKQVRYAAMRKAGR
jgi:hypothetical protein